MLSREVLANVWNDLVKWYIKRSRHWLRLAGLAKMESNDEEAKALLDKAYGLWGYVWHEHDLVLMYSHMLMKYVENHDLNIHLHVAYELKPRNFSVMKDFCRKLVKATTTLRKELGVGRKWFPEVDLIVARDEPPSILYRV